MIIGPSILTSLRRQHRVEHAVLLCGPVHADRGGRPCRDRGLRRPCSRRRRRWTPRGCDHRHPVGVHLGSAIIDNIPYTATAIPIVEGMIATGIAGEPSVGAGVSSAALAATSPSSAPLQHVVVNLAVSRRAPDHLRAVPALRLGRGSLVSLAISTAYLWLLPEDRDARAIRNDLWSERTLDHEVGIGRGERRWPDRTYLIDQRGLVGVHAPAHALEPRRRRLLGRPSPRTSMITGPVFATTAGCRPHSAGRRWRPRHATRSAASPRRCARSLMSVPPDRPHVPSPTASPAIRSRGRGRPRTASRERRLHEADRAQPAIHTRRIGGEGIGHAFWDGSRDVVEASRLGPLESCATDESLTVTACVESCFPIPAGPSRVR